VAAAALSPPNENVGAGAGTEAGAALLPPKVKGAAGELVEGLAPKLNNPLELPVLVTGVAPNEDAETEVVTGAWKPPNGLLLVTGAAPKLNVGFTSPEFSNPPNPEEGAGCAVVVGAFVPKPPKLAVDTGAAAVLAAVAPKLKDGAALACPNWKAGAGSLVLGAVEAVEAGGKHPNEKTLCWGPLPPLTTLCWGPLLPNDVAEVVVEVWPNEKTGRVVVEGKGAFVVAPKFKVGAAAVPEPTLNPEHLVAPNWKGESWLELSFTTLATVVCPKLKIGGTLSLGLLDSAAVALVAVEPKLKVGATDAVAPVFLLVSPNLKRESVVVVPGADVTPKVSVGKEEVAAEAPKVSPRLKEAADDSVEDLLTSPKDGGFVVEAVDNVFSSFESV